MLLRRVMKPMYQISNPSLWVNIYNSYAWKASGMDLTSPGTDLDFAAEMSKKSLDILDYLKEHPEANTNGVDVLGMHHMCADTYALILYKQKKYDLAFEYQHEIVEAAGDMMSTDGKERYAAFSEEARGPEFTREYLENQLLSGTDSRIMVEQLQKIYAELNLPEDEFENEDVEIFFINSWENQEPEKVREKVVEFLTEKEYNFNVLFDYNDEVISSYKVLGIPTRFLIDKDGNLKSIVRYSDDLAAMIRESL